MHHSAFGDASDGRGQTDIGPSSTPLSMLIYRSRAVDPQSANDLDRLLQKARERNRAEGLTGLLIYDQGNFFQWLEGPEAGLERVWDSIRRDPRHRQVQVLRSQSIPKRFFGAWAMRLALRTDPEARDAFAIVGRSTAGRLTAARPTTPPNVLSPLAWDALFADLVVPRLRTAHLPSPMPTGIAWHANDDAAAELAELSLDVDSAGTAGYIDELVAQGASLETLYREVLEPAARHLGDLGEEDRRTDGQVALGLGRLQFEVRRLHTTLPHPLHFIRPDHTVLVAPQPGEPHGVTAAMTSELFWRDGWHVSCEFPGTDAMLESLVHDRWFDVLDLSLSGAYRRESRLKDMGVSIRLAQAASLNPALAVLVNGRAFFERSHAYFSLGADAACATVVESVATAQRLLDTMTTQHRIAQTLMDPPHGRKTLPVPQPVHGRAGRRVIRRRSHPSA